MSGLKSAWLDPDHVRQATCRSWWDTPERHALRGALPAFVDPWVTDTHPERTPAPQPEGKRGYPRHDDYAAFRCACDHLVYADQQPGDPCLFCACADHRPQAGAA